MSFKLISGRGRTWGYDIFRDGKLMVHQPTIPALPGNSGFRDKSAAARIAKLVIKKIENGEIPPTLSVNELRKEKVID